MPPEQELPCMRSKMAAGWSSESERNLIFDDESWRSSGSNSETLRCVGTRSRSVSNRHGFRVSRIVSRACCTPEGIHREQGSVDGRSIYMCQGPAQISHPYRPQVDMICERHLTETRWTSEEKMQHSGCGRDFNGWTTYDRPLRYQAVQHPSSEPDKAS